MLAQDCTCMLAQDSKSANLPLHSCMKACQAGMQTTQ